MTGQTTEPKAVLANSDADYARLGLQRDGIRAWEDGARTDGGKGTYEWWYFDSILEDGAKVIVSLMAKDLQDSTGPLAPTVRIELDLPDGRTLVRVQTLEPGAYSSSTERT